MTISSYVSPGGELCLSNTGQLALLQCMMERGVPLRSMVRGFSMAPFIRDGDVLTIAPMEGRDPLPGEVIAFSLPATGRMAIHRVIARQETGWILRGDNCRNTDGVVTREHLVGRVMRVERNGRNVRLGLGAEGAWIAALNRNGAWMGLKTIWGLPRRIAGFAFRHAQSLCS